MTKEDINIEELKKEKEKVEETMEAEEVTINDDGKQLLVRIPNKFRVSANIDKKKDTFIFELHLPGAHSTFKKPQLRGKLKRGKS